jgi:hypothetical protein
MHMVDDASSTVHCQFFQEETIWAAAALLRSWIEHYGVPRALYTDWKNVYVRPPNAQERLRGEPAVTLRIRGSTAAFPSRPAWQDEIR